MEVTASVVIGRAVGTVQSFVADLANEEKYWQGVKSMKLVSGQPGKVGAKYERVFEAMGKEQTTTVEIRHVDPERIVVESAPGPVQVTGDMTIKTAVPPPGTKLTMTLHIKTRGLTMLMAPMIKREMMKTLPDNLTRLKTVLERESAAGYRSRPVEPPKKTK